MVRVFETTELGGSAAANAVLEGEDGLLYLAYNERILQFDGARWRPIAGPEGGHIFLALATRGPDRIYYGGLNGIGYVQRIPVGTWEIHALDARLPEALRETGYFSSVIPVADGVYFRGHHHVVFLHDDGTHQVWEFPQFIGGIFSRGERIFAYGAQPLLTELLPGGGRRDVPFVVPSEAEVFVSAHAQWSESGDKRLDLLAVRGAGLFVFDGEQVESLEKGDFPELRTTFDISALESLSDGSIAVGTTSHGVSIYRKDGQRWARLDSRVGLGDDGALDLHADRQGGLWVASSGALSRIIVPSATTIFDRRHGLRGQVNAVKRFQGQLFVGTTGGLWRQTLDGKGNEVFEIVVEGNAVRSLVATEEALFIGTMHNALLFDGVTVREIAPLDAGYLLASDVFPDRIYGGGSAGISIVEKVDGRWIYQGRISTLNRPVHGLVEDVEGALWVVTGNEATLRITFEEGEPSVRRFGAEDGLAGGEWIAPLGLNGAIFIPTGGTVLRYDIETDRLVPANGYVYFPKDPPNYFPQMLGDPQGQVWVSFSPGRPKLYPQPTGDYAAAIQNVSRSPDQHTMDVHVDRGGLIFLALPDGIVRFDPSLDRDPPGGAQTRVSRIIDLDTGQVLAYEPSGSLRLGPAHNSLRFEFGLSHFQNPARNQFTYTLKGFDREWFPYGEVTAKDYTNLPPGRYAFLVTGRDPALHGYNTASVEILIEAPFYRSVAAYFLYVLMVCLLAYGLIRWRVGHFTRSNRRLNEEVATRTRELSEQAILLSKSNQQLQEALDREGEMRKRAQEATLIKSRFLANMSHELRTPMNGVIGMCSLLEETRLDEDQLDFVNTIRQSSETLLNILNDILDLSVVESGKLEIVAKPFNVADAVEEVGELMMPLAYRKGVRLHIYIAPQTRVARIGDTNRLRQILLNLTGNAIKFIEEGSVTVSVGEDPLEGDGASLVIQVKDTGIGIAEEEIQRLFTSFTQLDASARRRHGGTGLGLVISKYFVEAMGGSITVESEPGVGSCFSIRLPLPLASGADLPEAIPAETGSGRVLLVGNDQPTLHYARDLFRHWGLTAEIEPWSEVTVALPGALDDYVLIAVDYADAVAAAAPGELPRGLRRMVSAAPCLLLAEAREHLAAQELGAQGFLFARLPLRHRQLREALIVARGRSIAPTALPEVTEAPSPRPRTSELSVLVAEDNKTNQKVALLILERLGYQADTVSDGCQVLEALQKRSYDVIIMDNHMPNLDGVAATARIRSEYPPARQPYILAFSASVLEEDRLHFREAGMDDFLGKPMRKDALASALARAEIVIKHRRSKSVENH